ncbi:hypothetical protein [Legionella tucsonensis]|uniref:Uncharacterized protein n=1 Tax=Legionella tucsonensis TaxID=40335 RepID=A0A0W0ZXP4_9GAMM|nr:hypothetical protein [Legionella tucsonensis]KTD73915.1 hypothetical protein Ltuc_1762 [Legionella tucsonensis]
MRQINDNQYTQFTPKERVNLTFAALSRGDETEADRLWQTCPRYRYVAHDFEYTLGVSALTVLGSLFFEKCVTHYNLIKRAELLIMGSEQDLEYEEKEGFDDFAIQARKFIELLNKTQQTHISKLKGLFEGFRQFCSEEGFDSENILRTIPVHGCCHDLDALLASDIQIDPQHVSQVKDIFLEQWRH